MPLRHVQYTSRLENRHLHRVGIGLAVAFWLLLATVHKVVLPETLTFAEALLDLALILLGAVAFWTWAMRRLAQREAQIRRHVDQLEALNAAALALTAELDLGTVLQTVVDQSRRLVNARYGALGVLAEDGRFLEQFITSGLSPKQRVRIGHPPQGDGLLRIPIREERPIRVPEISRDTRSSGFPAHHPPMHSLLAVPIIAKGKIIGILYLTDKIETGEQSQALLGVFSEQDEALLVMFATQAAIAIENARLYRQHERLAICQERERFSRDLHDGAIQSLYAIGLILEDGQHRIQSEPQTACQRVGQAIHELNDVIQDIRNYILDLSAQQFQERDLQQGLEELVREVRADSFLSVGLEVETGEEVVLSAEQTAEILSIVQEALSNVLRHALATQAQVHLQDADGQLILTVEDNGIGFDPHALPVPSGRGLHNMRQRAAVLHGHLHIERAEAGGMRVRLTVPL